MSLRIRTDAAGAVAPRPGAQGTRLDAVLRAGQQTQANRLVRDWRMDRYDTAPGNDSDFDRNLFRMARSKTTPKNPVRVLIDVRHSFSTRQPTGPISHDVVLRFVPGAAADVSESNELTDAREAVIDAIKKLQKTYKPVQSFNAQSSIFMTDKDPSHVRPLMLNADTPEKSSKHLAAEFAQDLVSKLKDLKAYHRFVAMEPDPELVPAAEPEVDFGGL